MHRPTWNTSIGFATGNTSKVFSTRDMAGETRLKFRKPGQGTTTEIERKDLKLELLAAERESESRKAKGLPGFAGEGVALIEAAPVSSNEDTKKRREAIALVGGLDADDEDEDDIVIPSVSNGKGKGRATSSEIEQDFKAKEDDDDDDEEEESSDDDEDETAELLRELEKIKRERAEEKEKIEREKAASDYVSREEEIATGNPLLNLQSALNIPGSPSPSISSTGSSSFGIKRRWDDDVIFKNQARGTSETPKKEFVNDLLRSEFHKRFMKKHIA